ncbi:MAG: alginate lyase family protein [Bacteroidota bacterium]
MRANHSVSLLIVLFSLAACLLPRLACAQVIFHEAEPANGAVVSTVAPHSGNTCLVWQHGKSASLRFPQVPADWTLYDTLTMWLRTQTPGGASFYLIIPSENDQTEGSDYYSARITVQPGGWQEFSFNLAEELGRNRQPLGFDKIGGMYCTADGWEQTLNPEAVVQVDDVRLEKRGPVQGPRLTDQQFIEALDLTLPALAAVKAAADKADWPAAKTEYVKYLRSLPHPWKFDWRTRPTTPNPQANTAAADAAMKRRYVVCSVPYDFKGGDIDWTVNPTNPVNNEWIWQFSRHHWWPQLANAYWATGDEKYAKEFVYNLQDWVRDCPIPKGKVNNNAGSRWRTIECGIRMAGPWPETFFRFLSSPSFTDDAIIDMVKSMVEHARYLQQYPTTGNWLTMECNGLYHVGCLFPEFKEAASWRDTAVARLYKDLDVQVYPDGAQIELAPGYHQVSLYNFLGLVDAAKLTGQTLPDEYLHKLEKMWDYNMWLMGPDGASPAFNDSGPTDLRRTLQDGLKYFPNREDWKWLATRGADGKAPEGLSHAFEWAGQYVMRSGWRPEDLWCVFEGGPYGYGHQHEDKLGFTMSAYGSRLVIDTGVYTYDASDWRRYVLGPTAHSTLFIDGNGQRRGGEPRESYVNKTPETNPWFSTPEFDYVSAQYSEGFGQKKERLAVQTREILFIKPDYYLVIDTIKPTDAAAHDYTAYFHLRPAEAKVLEDGRTILTENGGAANLAVIPVTQQNLTTEVIKGQKQPFLLGWTLKSGLECEPVPVATYKWRAAGGCQVAYVFYPLKPGDKTLPVVTPTASGFAVKVGDRTDEVQLGAKPRVVVTRKQGEKTVSLSRVELP